MSSTSARERACNGVLLGLSLVVWASTGCNSLLGIDEARLTCDPEDCAKNGSQGSPAPGACMIRQACVAAPSDPDAGSAGSALPAGPPATGAGSIAGSSIGTSSMDTTATPSTLLPTTQPAATSASAPPAEAPVAAASSPDASAGSPAPDPAPASADPPLGPDGLAVALPNDLIAAPVSGEIVYSDDAVWEVNGVFQPTFEIHTPTASYWIVKPLGTLVSLEDAAGTQWIAFSSGFRPLRGVPSFAAPPAAVTTLRDDDSQTPTHLRLTSATADGLWQWVWDFYITHVTFTVNRAPVPIGFAYQGVPGGNLGTEDQLISSDGTSQSARNSFEADLPGPAEWVYLADTAENHAIFLIQHRDDTLVDRYQVRDNDSAMWVFGNGEIQALPIRFSLGLIDRIDRASVAARVQFVVGAIH